ncbi:hypothetical protein L2E82_19092 [Cichorium intybus]|uniref:Uncharacterized protein n=1 Tax=Cichorium intybus TaxID=13427 RepID=A0ACB9FBE0_CICIN|nr:hypothetical protein L2E82_19092 [Cichorium intybus]
MYSSNPFSQLPSSTDGFTLPNSFLFHEKEDVHYNHHLKNGDPFISSDFLFHAYDSYAPPPPPVIGNVATIKEDFATQQQFSEGSGLQYSEDHSDLLDSVISRYKNRIETSKKDGHSKIYTARGPRDRRVRLSIEISRKFFCLQDLLGFDKASKTLDWLFSNSLTAIQKLVEETTHCSSSTVTEQSKLTFLETINGGSVDVKVQKRKSVPMCVVNTKSKKTTMRRFKAGFQDDLARDQSRAEARARARERTREKLRVNRT